MSFLNKEQSGGQNVGFCGAGVLQKRCRMRLLRVLPAIRTSDTSIIWTVGLLVNPLEGVDVPQCTLGEPQAVYSLLLGPIPRRRVT